MSSVIPSWKIAVNLMIFSFSVRKRLFTDRSTDWSLNESDP